MAIKFIALDLDGTLIDEKSGSIPHQNMEAIERAQQAGIIVCPCTGRSMKSTRVVLKDTTLLEHPLIASNGSVISCGGKIMKSWPLGQDNMRVVYDATRDMPLHFLFFTVDEIYSLSGDRARIQKRYPGMPDNPDIGVPTPQHDFSCMMDQSITVLKMLLVLHDVSIQPELFARLDKLTGVQYTYSYDDRIEITAKGVTKASGLKWLTEHYGIPQQQTMAIGDSPNDIDMLHWVQVPVAMGNAPQRLKDIASHVVADDANAGVAQAIDEIALGKN